jgi:hypothetical protein
MMPHQAYLTSVFGVTESLSTVIAPHGNLAYRYAEWCGRSEAYRTALNRWRTIMGLASVGVIPPDMEEVLGRYGIPLTEAYGLSPYEWLLLCGEVYEVKELMEEVWALWGISRGRIEAHV